MFVFPCIINCLIYVLNGTSFVVKINCVLKYYQFVFHRRQNMQEEFFRGGGGGGGGGGRGGGGSRRHFYQEAFFLDTWTLSLYFHVVFYAVNFCGQNTKYIYKEIRIKILETISGSRGRFHEASFVFSFLKVKDGGFLTFGKASLKSCFTKPPLFHLAKDFP